MAQISISFVAEPGRDLVAYFRDAEGAQIGGWVSNGVVEVSSGVYTFAMEVTTARRLRARTVSFWERGGGQVVLHTITEADFDAAAAIGLDPGLAVKTAGESLSGHSVVCCRDNLLYECSMENVIAGRECFGVTTGAAMAGQPAIARTYGEIEEPSWNWVPGILYLGAGSRLTQIPPDKVIAQIGVAIGATTMLVRILQPVILGG